ncbi:hypothetical protein ACW0KB_08615 [Virgibacillus salarius]
MKNNRLKKFIFLGSFLGIIGLLLIFFSNSMGMAFGDGWLVKSDYADSSIYNFQVKANTNKFLVIGGILFGIGLTTVLLSYYKELQNKE